MTHATLPNAAGSAASPKVSIGLPVFNGADSLHHALKSLLCQSFTDFELIVSDNASTDGTDDICREYAARDRRIRYYRQPTNHGPGANFQFVLDQAVGEFFMWAAADDAWHKDFIASNFHVLSSNPACIASISRVVFVDPDGKIVQPSSADSPLVGSAHRRLATFLKDPADNSRMYSLFRRPALDGLTLQKYRFHAADWFIVAKLLLAGEFHTVDEVQLTRLVAQHGRYSQSAPADNRERLTIGFPLLPWTIELCKTIPWYTSLACAFSLARLNIRHRMRYRTIRRAGRLPSSDTQA